MYSTFHDDMSYRLSVCVFDYHMDIDRSNIVDLMNGKYIDHRRLEEISSLPMRKKDEPNETGQYLKSKNKHIRLFSSRDFI
jgi:hypothetical protein